MPTLAQPAFYRPGPPVTARQAPSDTVVRLRNAAGEVVDEMAVIAGEWVVIEGGRARTEESDAFGAGYDALPGSPARFVRRALAAAFRQPLDGPDADGFRHGMLRCARDGTPICAADAPLSVQATALTGATDAASARAHMAVLREIHALAVARPVFDPAVQADMHAFNVMAAYFGEKQMDGDRELPGGGLMPQDVPGVIAEAAAAAGVQAPAWTAMDDLPGAGVPQMRLLREHLFADLTDVPLGEIRAAFQPHTEDETAYGTFVDWLRRSGETRKVDRPPNFSNLAPGYECRVAKFARDGVEFLVVEDFAMTAVYAWPDAAPAPLPEPAPRPV